VKILIYTTHRTGSTSLANFLMYELGYDYQRYWYFTKNKNKLPSDIIIKLTPNEVKYDDVAHLFDKVIVLIREDIDAQSESRVFSEKFGKKFSSYSIPTEFFIEYKSEIESMRSIILCENEILKNLKNCLFLTYEEFYKSDIGLSKLEEYLATKFKFTIDYNPYRNMRKNLV
jgi:hypothetical protein